HVAPIHADVVKRAVFTVIGTERERPGQKDNEFGRAHFARGHRELTVMDSAQPADVAFDWHVIGRIGENQLSLIRFHQDVVSVLVERAAAIHAMWPKYPQISRTAYAWTRLCGRNRIGTVVLR